MVPTGLMGLMAKRGCGLRLGRFFAEPDDGGAEDEANG